MYLRLMGLLCLGWLTACDAGSPTQTTEATAPVSSWLTRHEASVVEYEAADRENPPPESPILFVGSSSIRMWKSLQEDMSPLSVLNRGFGGSTFPELLHYLDRLVLRYKPKAIVLYEGDNDIVPDSMSPQMVLTNLQRYQQRVQEVLPGVKTWFLAVKPSISRKALLPKARTTNSLIEAYCLTEPSLEFVDVASPMLLEEGGIRPDIFVQDSLHMNARGYELWTAVLKPRLTKAYLNN